MCLASANICVYVCCISNIQYESDSPAYSRIDLKMQRSQTSCNQTFCTSVSSCWPLLSSFSDSFSDTMTHLETRHLQLSLPGVQLHTLLPEASPACELNQWLRLELLRSDLRYELSRIIKCQLLHIQYIDTQD